tara:strand:+ start:1145 stop:1687 length:543 start_codon:yes stop_codon:yes gene_type:complete
MGIIYKIQVHDEFYIGSTCDLIKRQTNHRKDCKNINSPLYNCRVYQKCRENDINIVLIPLEEIAGLKGEDLKMLEQEYMDRLKPELNTIRAYRSEARRKADYILHSKKPAYIEYKKAWHKVRSSDPAFIEHSRLVAQERYKKTKEPTTCECGSVVTIHSLTKHKKTKKHLTLMNNINNIN